MLDAREAKGIPASYLTDVVRAVVNREAPSLDLMTRENIVTMLRASNKTLEECEGQCEVDTGRLLGVDYIFSGDLVHFGSKFKVSLRVHETAKGRLIDTAFASANDADALEEATRIAAIGLVRRFLGPTGGARNR